MNRRSPARRFPSLRRRRVRPLRPGRWAATPATRARGLGAEGTGVLARKVIYFDFDKSEIKPEFADIVTTAARNLTSNPNLKVKLEGNTDERGTREYNIGLGERRAQAVRRALMLQGVAESQVSHGELRRRTAGRGRR